MTTEHTDPLEAAIAEFRRLCPNIAAQPGAIDAFRAGWHAADLEAARNERERLEAEFAAL